MKYAAGPRRELGIRSIFNLLGPLTNPAGVKRFVIGVFSDELCRPIAEVMKQLGAEHVMVVHSKTVLMKSVLLLLLLLPNSKMVKLLSGRLILKMWELSRKL